MQDFLNLNPITSIAEVPEDTVYKILYVTDLHWLLNIVAKNRDAHLLAMQQVSIQQGLYNLIKENKVQYVIFGGDVFNAGQRYPDYELLTSAEEFLQMVEEIAEMYVDYGNHAWSFGANNPIYKYVDNQHPEVQRILQKAKFYVPKKPMHPFMKCIPMLDFGTTHIHLIPFDPDKRDFVIQDYGDTFNVGVFHNDYITAESEDYYYHHRHGHGLSIYKTNLFECLDVAILNHLHKPFASFRMNNLRNTLVIIPGATCQRAINEVHDHVDLPLQYISPTKTDFTFVRLNLGEIKTTVKQEVVEEEKEKRATKKFVEKSKTKTKTHTHESLLNSVNDPRVRTIMETSDRLTYPNSLKRYYGLL